MRASEWYVLWVATGQEAALRAKAAALPMVDRALCPKALLWERKNGAWSQAEKLLFPGYIFLKCQMGSGVYYALRDLPGVMGWLGRDTLWPSTVQRDEMDAVLAMDGGGDPRMLLSDVTVNRRQRRGYGTIKLKGQAYKIPFNVYADTATEKQAEEPSGDTSPEDDEADQTEL